METDEQSAADGRRPAVDGSLPGVDEVIAPLAGLVDAPLREHAPVFEGVHARLHRLLTEPDQ